MALTPQTKSPPNESTNPTLKARGPRRGAHDPGFPVHGPAAQRWRMGQVTPALGPLSTDLGPSNSNQR